jgi:hypothetical protein
MLVGTGRPKTKIRNEYSLMRPLQRQIEMAGDALSQGRRYRIKSPMQVVIAYLSMAVVAFFALIVLILAGDPAGISKLDAWEVLMIIFVPALLSCWVSAQYSWVEVSPSGIRVVNPLNEATIPWSQLCDLDADAGYFRAVTSEWSIRAWAVQGSNLESSLRPGRVEEFVRVMSDYRAAAMSEGTARQGRANKRWRIPLRPVVGSVTVGLIAGAILWVA